MKRFGLIWCVPANGNNSVRGFVVPGYTERREAQA